ncbi:MAG: alpha/beta hydrolase [Armatimonadota bacterium]
MPRRHFSPRLSLLVLAAGLALVSPAAGQNPERLNLSEISAQLEKGAEGDAGRALAARLREGFGAEALRDGTAARLEGTRVLWAVESPDARPSVVPVGNIRAWQLTRLADTDVYAAVANLPNFHVTAFQYQVNGRRFGGRALQVEHFAPHPDTVERQGVSKGKVTKHEWRSRVFDGTIRDYWVYVPVQYRDEQPAAVMVFQDGESYLRQAKMATVFDNLIARGDLPPTIGIFINPGRFENGRSNRSFEYDTLSDQYARFIRDEILPEVGKSYRLTTDPERRAICGISSGAICAWTVAWQMPDQFRKVISHVGSYVNIAAGPTLREGGHNYAALIRKTPKKPIRVWLQDGANDLNNEHGNWPLANQEMASSLDFAGYDYYFDYGKGFHSLNHGAATLPESLRWLFRDVR